ncbi:MAG: glycoside hydrolase family 2 protein [bacterium]|nr:glycoside hydrolase family 2 protein [bacterium]
MFLTTLNGKWQLRFADGKQLYDAEVPGSVFSDLMNNGVMEDPFLGDNEYKALELSKSDFEYIRDFYLENIDFDHIFLNCDGLDTLCDVYLNDVLILKADNMHRCYKTEITGYVKSGINTIRIYINSPTMYALRKNDEQFLTSCADAVPGISHIRKAHYMFGWDWGPKLPDSGIWRDIYITAFNKSRLGDIQIAHDGTEQEWSIKISTEVLSEDISCCEVEYSLTSPEGEIIYCSNESKIKIPSPKLWWPNNMGDQPLYTLSVRLIENGTETDTRSYKLGLRKIKLIRRPDKWGESFEFEINGQSIFAMGADYIPEDNLLPRITRERSEQLIRACAEANFNMLRIWGGGYYPDDWFYDLCDKYGILIWQDHLYACGAYKFSDSFKESITAETEDNVRRLRHHACLALWSGNNELEYAWAYWGWGEAYGEELKHDYLRQFEEYLPALTKSLDPYTDYITSSPTSGGGFDDPNDENRGDMHYWEVWHGRKPLTDYRKLYPRFMSEFGLQSFPDIKTIKSFTDPEDRNIYSYIMECHQKNGTGNEKIMYYISEHFHYPKNLDAVVYLSQLVQAEGVRIGVEHWRRNRGRCMGALYWQLNDCWPGASWSGIDCYGRRKALHCFAKHFYAPLLIGSVYEDGCMALFVSNETREAVSDTAVWQLKSFEGEILMQGECTADTSPYSSQELTRIQMPDMTYTQKCGVYFEFGFKNSRKHEAAFLVPYKHLMLAEPEITYTVRYSGSRTHIELSAKKPALFVHIEANDCVFSDNYFHLMPGRTAEITADEYVPYENINISSLYNSFE